MWLMAHNPEGDLRNIGRNNVNADLKFLTIEERDAVNHVKWKHAI